MATAFASEAHAQFGGPSRHSTKKLALDPAMVEQWNAFEGKTVHTIHIRGLVRTREGAIRWLMTTTEGSSVQTVTLASDLQRLYNTGVLYEIHLNIIASPTHPDQVDLELTLKDKWTLLPIAGAVGGGGSLTYGGGVFDSNLGGYFISAIAIAYNYNGIFSYMFALSQEYIGGSQMLGRLAFANEVSPVIIHHIDGSAAGQFVWKRQREKAVWGYHFSDTRRLLVGLEIFTDNLIETKGVRAFTLTGTQYRIEPRFILGRVNAADYLDKGNELFLQVSSSNFAGPVEAYQSLEMGFKSLHLLPSQGNWGFQLRGGSMSPAAPPPYQFDVGGYSNIRGFISSRQVGPKMAYGNVEYRPLLYTGYWQSVGLDRVAIQGCLFTDFGSAWGDSYLTGDEGSRQFNMLWSAGAGLRLNLVQFAGVTMRLDVARTIRPDEGWGLAFGVGQFF